jgi:hypothetical protein
MTPGVIAHQNLTDDLSPSVRGGIRHHRLVALYPSALPRKGKPSTPMRGWAPMNQHIRVACTTNVAERFMCRLDIIIISIIIFCFHRPLSTRRLALLGHDQLTSSSADYAARLSFCKSTVAHQSCLGLPFSMIVMSLRVRSTAGFHILRPKVNHNVALVNLMVRQTPLYESPWLMLATATPRWDFRVRFTAANTCTVAAEVSHNCIGPTNA